MTSPVVACLMALLKRPVVPMKEKARSGFANIPGVGTTGKGRDSHVLGMYTSNMVPKEREHSASKKVLSTNIATATKAAPKEYSCEGIFKTIIGAQGAKSVKHGFNLDPLNTLTLLLYLWVEKKRKKEEEILLV